MRFLVVQLLAGLVGMTAVGGATIFGDNFDGGAAVDWGNEAGNWSASGGTYGAGAPDNFPNAHTSLPYDLVDFSFSVDISNVADGGIWMRSADASGSAIGRSGVLLVVRSSNLYFHHVATGASYGGIIGSVAHGGGPNLGLRVRVTGDEYAVFVDGATTPLTTYNTSSFASGEVALYSNSPQRFDNVSLTPEPGVAGLGLMGCWVLVLRRRRQASIGGMVRF